MDDLKGYFTEKNGFGVLSTSDGKGAVNAAVFSRPHCMEDGSVAFIMPERRTWANLSENPHAHYLFREEGPGYAGKRLALTKTAEEKDTDRLFELSRRESEADPEKPRHLVFFRVDAVLPLVGAK